MLGEQTIQQNIKPAGVFADILHSIHAGDEHLHTASWKFGEQTRKEELLGYHWPYCCHPEKLHYTFHPQASGE